MVNLLIEINRYSGIIYEYKEDIYKGYYEAVIGQMNYIIVFSRTNIVNITGVFHQLENYRRKI